MATITKGLIQREDFANYDGKTLVATRTDSTGGTLTGTRLGDAVDVRTVYGGGTASQGAIQKAIDSLGSNNIALLLTPETWTFASNLTIAANFTIIVPAGCILSPASGITLTIAGVLFRKHGTYTGGAGTVTISGTDLLAGAADTQVNIYGADSGAADAYVIATNASISSYAAGQTFRFKAANANTGASTINVDGQGVKSIVLFGTSAALPVNAILAGGVYTITYDGTNFQLQQQPATSYIEGLLDDATAAAARATLDVDQAGVSLANTTLFRATCADTENDGLTSGAYRLISFPTENYDLGSLFASEEYTPSGSGQYHWVYALLRIVGPSGANLADGTLVRIAISRYNSADSLQERLTQKFPMGAASGVDLTVGFVHLTTASGDYYRIEAQCAANFEVTSGVFGGWRIA